MFSWPFIPETTLLEELKNIYRFLIVERAGMDPSHPVYGKDAEGFANGIAMAADSILDRIEVLYGTEVLNKFLEDKT